MSVRPIFGASRRREVMLRRLQVFLVLVAGVVAAPAGAQDPAAEDRAESDAATEALPSDERMSGEAQFGDVAAKDDASSAPAAKPAASGGWRTYVSGYFRAPLAMGFSPRQAPDNPAGPKRMQISYGPNRTVDANYYSFAYTRLQEQDWAEFFAHAEREHIHAAVGA